MIDVIFTGAYHRLSMLLAATLAALARTSASPDGQGDSQQAGQLQRGTFVVTVSADRLVLLLDAGLGLHARSAAAPNIARVRSARFGRCLSISPRNWPSSRLHSRSNPVDSAVAARCASPSCPSQHSLYPFSRDILGVEKSRCPCRCGHRWRETTLQGAVTYMIPSTTLVSPRHRATSGDCRTTSSLGS